MKNVMNLTPEEKRAYFEALKRRLEKIRESNKIKEGVLAEIKNEQEKQQISPAVIKVLLEKIAKLEKEDKKRNKENKEIFKFSPEIYGIGINLKPLLKKFWNKLRKKK